MSKLTQKVVQAALEVADSEQSKLGEREKEIFGLSSMRLRALINNICHNAKSYLEIGVYRGATLISAAYGNKTNVTGIDNFRYEEREAKKLAPEGRIWDNMRSQLLANIDKYADGHAPVITDNIRIIEQSFEDVDWDTVENNIEVCFFDITPVSETQYNIFFEKVLPKLAQQAVIIFSNYSSEVSAENLNKALESNKDSFDINFKFQRISSGLSDATYYYSGILIMGVENKLAKPFLSSPNKPLPKIAIQK